MAKARFARDPRRGGALFVYVTGRIDGEVVSISRRVQDDREETARRVVERFNSDFALGDLSILRQALEQRRARRRGMRVASRGAGRRLHADRRAALELEKWRDAWIESLRGTIGTHTLRSYQSAVASAVELLGPSRKLPDLAPNDVIALRSAFLRAGLAERTIGDKIGAVRRMLDAAVIAGELGENPFAARLSTGRTKRKRHAARQRVAHKRPLSAAELEAILDVVRTPDPEHPLDPCWFPLTEALVLTGLRFGEVAALMWSVVDERAGRLEIVRAREHYGAADPTTPTKTGAEWSIPIRAPLADLLRRQRSRSLLGNRSGWIFPTSTGTAPGYHNWRNRVWRERILARAKVTLAAGDAQKLFRKGYVTSSLVCGRNPKRIASEVGHASLRMLTDQYEFWMDESHWPAPEELDALVRLYGFTDGTAAAELAARRGQEPGERSGDSL